MADIIFDNANNGTVRLENRIIRPFICRPNLVKMLKSGSQAEAKCIMCNYCGFVIEKESTKCLMGRIKI